MQTSVEPRLTCSLKVNVRVSTSWDGNVHFHLYLRSPLQKKILSQRAFDRDAVLGIRTDEDCTHPGTKPTSVSGSHGISGGDKG